MKYRNMRYFIRVFAVCKGARLGGSRIQSIEAKNVHENVICLSGM